MNNKKIATQLRLMAKLLEIKGANSFRVRAYNQAADTIVDFGSQIADLATDDGVVELVKLQGIGETIAEKIVTLVETGSIPQLEELKEEVPVALVQLTTVDGLGPKRVWQLFQLLGVKNLDDLKLAAEAGRISELDGFGEKLEAQILADVDRAASAAERILWPVAEEILVPLLEYLSRHKKITKLEPAGSFRRRVETIGDLDILAASKAGEEVIDYFSKYPGIKQVIAKGKTKCSVVLDTGIQADLRVVEPDSFGSALLYFTGSKAHGIALRNLAITQKKKVNEYGIYKGSRKLAGKTEKEMYSELGLKYIEPELREDRGEIAAAAQKKLPKLVTQAEIKGDFQCHTIGSDGIHTLEEMSAAAHEIGYEYLAVTDHSNLVGIVNGMSEKELLKQFKKIDTLNSEFRNQGRNFQILKSAEVDILPDGTLKYADEILAQMDFVVISVHSSFGLSREAQTERVIRAMHNPYANLLAHPTGRIIGRRKGYEIDLEQVIKTALKTNMAIELNCQPARMDLSDNFVKFAKDLGVKIGLSSDAHDAASLGVMRYGVAQARRGWLEKSEVLNTLSWPELSELLKAGLYREIYQTKKQS